MLNFKELVRLSDSITYLYAEKCHIEQDNLAIKLVYLDKEVPVPCAGLTVLMLGPGTTITHAAIVNLTKCGCLVVWIGENLRKFYAYGFGETHSAKNILKQAKACMDDNLHLEVAKRLYLMRFKDLDLDKEEVTIEKLRGLEGVRMRTYYQQCSKIYGVPWNGRKFDRNNYDKMDTVNKCLTYCNQLLYSIVTSAIITLGYNTSLGFIHVGNINSFVYDVADLYKTSISIPVSFEIASKKKKDKYLDIEKECRILCRQYFSKLNILKLICEDIDNLFIDIDLDYGKNSDSMIWNIEHDIHGNKNYAKD